MEKNTNSGHSDTYILVVLPFSNRPAATNHLDSGQFDWCFNLRTRLKQNLEDLTKTSQIKCDVLQLLAANYPTHSYVATLIYYFIRFLEKVFCLSYYVLNHGMSFQKTWKSAIVIFFVNNLVALLLGLFAGWFSF